uniref:polysaccharide deacetylase family protein n=1 Tax=Lactococcus garvieae TaxID=1363 RepID=UPI0025500D73
DHNLSEIVSERNKAYKTKQFKDIKKVYNLLDYYHLNKHDNRRILGDLKQLENMVNIITSSKKLVQKMEATPDVHNIKKAKDEVSELSGYYVQETKTNLMQQIHIVEDRIRKIKSEQNKYKDKKIIALTFDDGPNPLTTPILLQTLKQEKVPVTFFALGEQAEKYPDIIKKEAEYGHEVGSHTWDHKDLVTLSSKDQKREIQRASQFINKITGKDVKLFRPPYGSYNKDILNSVNLTAINWSIDTNDWRYTTSEPVISNAIDAAHDGAIILLHDIHPWSVNAVPQIIKELKQKGYNFVTVSTLLDIENNGIQKHKAYFGY